MYDNAYCFHYHMLSDIFGIGNGVVDAAQCGAIGAADYRCNPDFVSVRTEPPFNRCYCAAAGDLCTSRGTNSDYAVFMRQAPRGSDSFFRAGRFAIHNGPIHDSDGPPRDPELADSREWAGHAWGGFQMAPFGTVGLEAARCISERADPRSRVGRFTVRSSMDRPAIQTGPIQDPEWDESCAIRS